MISLGISPLDKDASVSLLVDGRLVCAMGEERYSRQKMHAGFPRQALQAALDMARITPAEVDVVSYAFAGWEDEQRMMRRNERADYAFNRKASRDSLSTKIAAARRRRYPRQLSVHGLSDAMETIQKPWHKRLAYRLLSSDGWLGDWANRRQFQQWLDTAIAAHREYHHELLAGLKEFNLHEKLVRVEHHQSHVANAFYMSRFERALVVTIDAYGSGHSGTVSEAGPDGIRRLHSIDTPYSLGTFYETVTSALGMKPDRHAGKVVGLASYGDPEILGEVIRSLFVWENGGFRIRRASDVYLSRRLSTEFAKIDLAAAYQTVLEEVVVRYVRHYIEATGCDAVALSGGVAANVKLNQRVFEIPGVKQIYIHPNMGDGGCGTGSAILQSLDAGNAIDPMRDAYCGPEFSAEEIRAALDAEQLQYEEHEAIEPVIARLVADNRVVARFNGRMEYGPRALGNRSILYQASDPAVNQWLNKRLGRTEFMPFAPATLYEHRHACYENIDGAEWTAQFMTITFDCTEQMKRQCPAAVHIDGTARPQLVTAESNPSFHGVLSEYHRLTGIPSLINTSFNMHEEPIVCTPQDAVRAFLMGRLDYLAIGNVLVAAPSESAAGR